MAPTGWFLSGGSDTVAPTGWFLQSTSHNVAYIWWFPQGCCGSCSIDLEFRSRLLLLPMQKDNMQLYTIGQ